MWLVRVSREGLLQQCHISCSLSIAIGFFFTDDFACVLRIRLSVCSHYFTFDVVIFIPVILHCCDLCLLPCPVFFSGCSFSVVTEPELAKIREAHFCSFETVSLDG